MADKEIENSQNTEKVKKVSSKIKDFLSNKLEYVIAFTVCAVVFAISSTSGFKSLEFKYYDLYLKLKSEIPQSKEISMAFIDDPAMGEIGTYPWSRDILANMLIRLREVGAKSAVFDIEYLDRSALGVNPDYVKNELPKEYTAMQNEVTNSVADFSQAIASKSLPISAASEIGQEINDYLSPLMNNMFNSISDNIFRDNDDYFAKALKYFGNAYLTINYCKVITETELAEESIAYCYENMLHNNIVDPKGLIKRDNIYELKNLRRDYGIGPAITPFLKSSAGAGFPNVVVDSDGVRRRYQLLSEYNGKYVAELVFEPLIHQLQPEQIIRKRHSLVLKNALSPDGSSNKRADIKIPLDSHGCMLINWVKTPIETSFKADSILFLYDIDKREESIISIFNDLAKLNWPFNFCQISEYIINEYEELETIKQQLLNEERNDFDDYFARRKELFSDMNMLNDESVQNEIFDYFAAARAETGDETIYADTEALIRQYFDAFSNDYQIYNENFERLVKMYKDCMCLIGNNAVGTTDLGVTPFFGYYANMGTHANLYNTIVNQSFITPIPKTYSMILMLIISYLFALVFRRLNKLNSRLIVGITIMVVVIFSLYAVFITFQIYIESLPIVSSNLLIFISITVARFILSEKDKNFLKKAFSTYLSGDIIDEIVKDPKKLALGGQEKELTAIFTDVRSFSTLSEKVTPTQLVYILNVYLSRMSDIVLQNKGTIDKFEGDAIIAFYGAPVDNPEHARCALMSAIRMKQAEVEINKYLLDRGEAPNELLTRIGINSGPMVVGNMGTESKMNYTIMGNDVNLAARLEGVNKVYGTWILASESTFNKAGPGFVGRRLDRVRVIGINKPVQLYNIIGLESETPDNVLEGVSLFHDALDTYLARDFDTAMNKFNKVLKVMPDDQPSLVYIEKARKLKVAGVPDEWDGVVNMTSK